MPLPEYAIALGDVYATMGQKDKAEGQYELVRSMDKLLRANGVNTDLEIALFYADHDMDLKTSLEKARTAYDARPSIHAADALAWTLYKTGNYKEAGSTPGGPEAGDPRSAQALPRRNDREVSGPEGAGSRVPAAGHRPEPAFLVALLR